MIIFRQKKHILEINKKYDTSLGIRALWIRLRVRRIVENDSLVKICTIGCIISYNRKETQ